MYSFLKFFINNLSISAFLPVVLTGNLFAVPFSKFEHSIKKSDNSESSWFDVHCVYKEEAPDVYQAFLKYQNYKKYIKWVKEVKVLEQKEDYSDVYFRIKAPWPVGNRELWIRFKGDKEKKEISWQLIKGSLKKFKGIVKLNSEKQKPKRYTKMSMQTHIRVGSLIPNFLVYWALKKYLPKILFRAYPYIRTNRYLRIKADRRKPLRRIKVNG